MGRIQTGHFLPMTDISCCPPYLQRNKRTSLVWTFDKLFLTWSHMATDDVRYAVLLSGDNQPF